MRRSRQERRGGCRPEAGRAISRGQTPSGQAFDSACSRVNGGFAGEAPYFDSGLARRVAPAAGVPFGEGLIPLRLQPGIVVDEIFDLSPFPADRVPPTGRRLIRLEDQLEEVSRDKLVRGNERTEFRASQGLQLLDDVADVGGRDPTLLQQRGLFLGPAVEIVLVEVAGSLVGMVVHADRPGGEDADDDQHHRSDVSTSVVAVEPLHAASSSGSRHPDRSAGRIEDDALDESQSR